MKFKYLWLAEQRDKVDKDFYHVKDVFDTRQKARNFKRKEKKFGTKIIISRVKQSYIKANVE